MRYTIYEGADVDLANPVGELTRVWPGWCAAMTDGNAYSVHWPAEQDAAKRAGLLAALILTNYVWYEGKKDKNNNNNGGGGY